MDLPVAVSVNKTLLAVLLALKDLETPLSEEEQKAFRDVAEQLQMELENSKKEQEASRNTVDQLQMDSQSWEDCKLDLLTVIEANPSLNQLYQTAKSQLDALNGEEIPSNLLPTPAELDAAIPTNQTPGERGNRPVNDGYKSHEITNMVINVISTANPPETAKKLSRIEQLQQFLQQSLKSK